jgi:hypothetical protein
LLPPAEPGPSTAPVAAETTPPGAVANPP